MEAVDFGVARGRRVPRRAPPPPCIDAGPRALRLRRSVPLCDVPIRCAIAARPSPQSGMGEGGGGSGAAAAGQGAGGGTGPTKMIDDPPPAAPGAPGGAEASRNAGEQVRGENGAPGKASAGAVASVRERGVAEMRSGKSGSMFGILVETEEPGSGEEGVNAAGKREVAGPGAHEVHDDEDAEEGTDSVKRPRRAGVVVDEPAIAVGMHVDSATVVAPAQADSGTIWGSVE